MDKEDAIAQAIEMKEYFIQVNLPVGVWNFLEVISATQNHTLDRVISEMTISSIMRSLDSLSEDDKHISALVMSDSSMKEECVKYMRSQCTQA